MNADGALSNVQNVDSTVSGANGVASWEQMGSRLGEQMGSRLVVTHSRREAGLVVAVAASGLRVRMSVVASM